MVFAINAALVESGYRLFIYNTCTELYWQTDADLGEKRIFELLDYSMVDALIIHNESIKDTELKEKLINNARSFGRPVFVIDGHYDDCCNINFDYSDGFAQVINHVITQHGCKKLHMMSGMKGNAFSMEREDVFRRILTENGLGCSEDSISYGDFWCDPAKAATEELIKRGDLPEAVICANDAMARAVCSTFIKHGVRVPEDVIVTGFDGLEEIFFFNPTITSCRYSYENLAKEIGKLLEKTERREKVEGTYMVGEELILNESCGCNRHKRINAADYVANLSGRLYRYQTDDCAFFEHIANIQCLDNLKDFYNEFKALNLYGMSCMINTECTDETVNPLDVPYGESFSGDMCLLYRYDMSGEFEPRSFYKEEIAPDMDYMLSIKAPLVFNALNFRNVPLGYMCFYFAPALEEYCRIPQVVNAFNIAIGGYRNIRYQKYITNRIDEISKRDMLTGLYNRSGFMKMFNDSSGFAGNSFTVISIDLDRLKYINDSFGHLEGDSAIKNFACLIEMGCPGRKICARFGGDEFAIITDCLDESKIRESLVSRIAEHNSRSGKAYELSGSIGMHVHLNTDPPETFDELLKQADRLMYEEKRLKKGNRA
ncbi:MAG: GGDEF domain-containing protein [Oscillospiraceae bacterium]|nr:GGDEF domain-containing protein [Oscillospiraceae bacterium]